MKKRKNRERDRKRCARMSQDKRSERKTGNTSTIDRGLDRVSGYEIMEIDNMKNKQLTMKEIDKILDYRRKGLSLRETAKLLGGITYETIRTIEKKYKKVGPQPSPQKGIIKK